MQQNLNYFAGQRGIGLDGKVLCCAENIRAQGLVYAGLVAGTLFAEGLEHIGIDAEGNLDFSGLVDVVVHQVVRSKFRQLP